MWTGSDEVRAAHLGVCNAELRRARARGAHVVLAHELLWPQLASGQLTCCWLTQKLPLLGRHVGDQSGFQRGSPGGWRVCRERAGLMEVLVVSSTSEASRLKKFATLPRYLRMHTNFGNRKVPRTPAAFLRDVV